VISIADTFWLFGRSEPGGGSSIRYQYDLMERGIAWDGAHESSPLVQDLVREVLDERARRKERLMHERAPRYIGALFGWMPVSPDCHAFILAGVRHAIPHAVWGLGHVIANQVTAHKPPIC
jgi:hypothetical protein